MEKEDQQIWEMSFILFLQLTLCTILVLRLGVISHAFTAAAITEIAHEKTLISSKAMAMTVVDVMYNPQLMEKIRKFKDFEKSHPATH